MALRRVGVSYFSLHLVVRSLDLRRLVFLRFSFTIAPPIIAPSEAVSINV